MCLSLHHDLTPMDKKYLEDLEFIKLWSRTPEETIQHHLDCIQSSTEEKQALHDLVIEHMHSDGKEWVNEEIDIGPLEDYTNLEYYTHLLDEAEMIMDMENFEKEEMCHQLFADNNWLSREYCPSTKVLTKKSEYVSWVKIIYVDESYSIGETEYGDVFIQHILDLNVGDYYLMTIVFKGFEGCNTTIMPWLALKVHMSSKP